MSSQRTTSRNLKSRTSNSKQEVYPAICKRRGKSPTNMHLSTKPIPKSKPKTETIPQKNPPQSELLVTEYVHNMKQQLFLLESEVRLLKDRAGVEDDVHGAPSIDNSIRKLRRALAQRELETNAKIEEYKKQIEEQNRINDSLDLSKSTEILQKANDHENETLSEAESGFVIQTSQITKSQLEAQHYEKLGQFIDEKRDEITEVLNQKKNDRSAKENEERELEKQLDDLRAARKALIEKLKNSISNKRNAEEEGDLVDLLSQQPELPPPNLSIATIKADNAKVEQQLQGAIRDRDDLQEQMVQLLNINVHLKAELKELESKVKESKIFKENMEKKFATITKRARETHDQYEAEYKKLKEEKKELKKQIKPLKAQWIEFCKQISSMEDEQLLFVQTADFKKQDKALNDTNCDSIKLEIEGYQTRIEEARSEIDRLTSLIGEASEKAKKLEEMVEMNNADPKCKLESIPPELKQLLDSINAVKDQI